MILRLTIAGPPLGKGRPRFSRATGAAFTPKTTAEWEGRARGEIAQQVPAGWALLDEPVAVFVTAVFPRPKSMICTHTSGRCRCEERHPQGQRLPFAKAPDGDNVEKIVWDAINAAGVWRDDARVVRHGARHYYATASEAAHTQVVIVWGDDLGRLLWPPDALEEW